MIGKSRRMKSHAWLRGRSSGTTDFGDWKIGEEVVLKHDRAGKKWKVVEVRYMIGGTSKSGMVALERYEGGKFRVEVPFCEVMRLSHKSKGKGIRYKSRGCVQKPLLREIQHPRLGLCLSFQVPYSEEFFSDFYSSICRSDREWNRGRRTFYVRASLRSKVEELLQKHFPTEDGTHDEEEPEGTGEVASEASVRTAPR